jgi:hypothetical protein
MPDATRKKPSATRTQKKAVKTVGIASPLVGPIGILATNIEIGSLKRIGTDRLVSIEGVTGLFTPIANPDTQPIGNDERKNLLNIIDQLKGEIAKLGSDNLQLKNRIDTLTQRPSAPDDFASAVQQSVDELQQRMATMRNAMSNFAVRELKLDAGVFVQVSPVGSIEYRFIQPGDNIEAAAVSRLSLDIVPVPRNDLAGVWTANLFQPELPISALPGMTAEETKLMEGAGLYSIGEFLQVGTRARAQAYLESLLGTERNRLALWAQQAALMTLRGVNGATAMILIEAGLGSFEALAGSAADALASQFAAVRQKYPEFNAPEVDSDLTTLWIHGARQYLGLPEIKVQV